MLEARSWMKGDNQRPIQSYRDLIHRLTLKFPAFERGELGSQLRRSSSSIPINIAEGYGRKKSSDDFKRFLVIALGSCDETSVLLDFAHDLNYLDETAYADLKEKYKEIGKGLNKTIQVGSNPVSSFELQASRFGRGAFCGGKGRARALLNATEETLPA
jgi:four helix bundle protein